MNESSPASSSAGSGLLSSRYVEALIRHEQAIGQLYDAIADRLPEEKAFWQSLAREERAHAAVLTDLRKLVERGAAAHVRPSFTLAQIVESLDFLAVNRKEIGVAGITFARALDMALRIEQSIIETDYFAVFSDDSAELRSEFDALRKHTQEHIERILRRRSAERP